MESLIKVRLEGVGFAYAPGREARRGLDLEVLPGERVALVGASGAGKTTVVQPLLGFLRPDTVRILVYGADLDGLDLADFHGEDLRRHIALVSQHSHLFDASIPSPPRAWMPPLSDRSWPPSITSWWGSRP